MAGTDVDKLARHMMSLAVCLLLLASALHPAVFATSCDKNEPSGESLGYELLEHRLESLQNLVVQLSEQMKDLGGKMDQLLKTHDSTEKTPNVPEPADSNISSNSAASLEDPCLSAQQSGLYSLNVTNTPLTVLCEEETFDGGWLVIQQRLDGSERFDRSWTDYRNGFGRVGNRTEFWLGLDAIHRLVSRADYELAVELRDDSGKYGVARFSDFKIGGEEDWYKLVEVGRYDGTAGDQLRYSEGRNFSTIDSDNDVWRDGNCAKLYSSGWWYGHCAYSFLNGPFTKDKSTGYGIAWAPWTTAARYSRMMVRRKV